LLNRFGPRPFKFELRSLSKILLIVLQFLNLLLRLLSLRNLLLLLLRLFGPLRHILLPLL
jgi:hypothetical protein